MGILKLVLDRTEYMILKHAMIFNFIIPKSDFKQYYFSVFVMPYVSVGNVVISLGAVTLWVQSWVRLASVGISSWTLVWFIERAIRSRLFNMFLYKIQYQHVVCPQMVPNYLKTLFGIKLSSKRERSVSQNFSFEKSVMYHMLFPYTPHLLRLDGFDNSIFFASTCRVTC